MLSIVLRSVWSRRRATRADSHETARNVSQTRDTKTERGLPGKSDVEKIKKKERDGKSHRGEGEE